MKRTVMIAAAGLGLAAAVAVPAAAMASTSAAHGVCVQHGKTGSVLGNVMLYDWNDSKCPAHTYGPVSLSGITAPAPAAPTTKDFGTATNVITGGSFVTNSTEAGTVTLKAGTYVLSVNAKATPTGGADPVFPQFFVYNQAKNASFTGDLFNIGSGALAAGSSSLDSYFSGTTTITLGSETTLHIYAFGYSADKGAGAYTLDDLTITAVPVG